MISEIEFQSFFNKDFWKALRKLVGILDIPSAKTDRNALVTSVYQDLKSNAFQPSPLAGELISNKGHGIIRKIPVLAIRDYIVYFYCVRQLEAILSANRVNNTFGGWSLSSPRRTEEAQEGDIESGNYGALAFNPFAWVKEFGEFNSILFSAIDEWSYPWVIQLDIANFYDSIRLNILKSQMTVNANQDELEVIEQLFHFLSRLKLTASDLLPNTVGLPPDALADCSRLLANFYLTEYDAYAKTVCDANNAIYLRYADDQIILARTPEEYEKILYLLSDYLYGLGLKINQKKVVVSASGSFLKSRSRNQHYAVSNRSDPGFESRVDEFIEYAVGIRNGSELWNGKNPLLRRALNLLSHTSNMATQWKLLKDVSTSDFLRQASEGELKKVYELALDFGEGDEFIEKLMLLSDTLIHNLFHYAVLRFLGGIQRPDLVKQVSNRIEYLNWQAGGVKIE